MRRHKALGIDPDKEQDKGGRLLPKITSSSSMPHAPIFIAMDKTLTPWSVFDCGAFVHGFLLAAHAEGLGACPQAMPTAIPMRSALNWESLTTWRSFSASPSDTLIWECR